MARSYHQPDLMNFFMVPSRGKQQQINGGGRKEKKMERGKEGKEGKEATANNEGKQGCPQM